MAVAQRPLRRLLKESRRIANNIDDGVIERDAHIMPLRPLWPG